MRRVYNPEFQIIIREEEREERKEMPPNKLNQTSLLERRGVNVLPGSG